MWVWMTGQILLLCMLMMMQLHVGIYAPQMQVQYWSKNKWAAENIIYRPNNIHPSTHSFGWKAFQPSTTLETQHMNKCNIFKPVCWARNIAVAFIRRVTQIHLSHNNYLSYIMFHVCNLYVNYYCYVLTTSALHYKAQLRFRYTIPHNFSTMKWTLY